MIMLVCPLKREHFSPHFYFVLNSSEEYCMSEDRPHYTLYYGKF
jgi:hypothetical protein